MWLVGAQGVDSYAAELRVAYVGLVKLSARIRACSCAHVQLFACRTHLKNANMFVTNHAQRCCQRSFVGKKKPVLLLAKSTLLWAKSVLVTKPTLCEHPTFRL
jgi:hypothetical protein